MAWTIIIVHGIHTLYIYIIHAVYDARCMVISNSIHKIISNLNVKIKLEVKFLKFIILPATNS